MRFFLGKFYYACSLLILPHLLLAAGNADDQFSQPYLVHFWQTDDGLPQNWVSCITQTPDGYLWIGTRYGGLARFDGIRFVPFNPANTPELKDVQVEYADVDSKGALWVMMGNESVTGNADGRFKLFRQPRAEPRLRAQYVLALGSNSVLFVDEGDRLARLNLNSSNTWELFAPNPAASGLGQVFRIDQAGTVWFISQSGALGRFSNGKFDTRSGANLPKSHLTALTSDLQGRIWVTSSNQIFCQVANEFEEVTPTNGPPAANIQDIVSCPDGGFWVRDGNHLRKGLGQSWTGDASLSDSIRRDNTAHKSQLFCDSEGNAWLVDYGNGLWCVRSEGSAFVLTERNGLPNGFITSWFQDKENNIWVGTVGGVARINKRSVRLLGPAENLPGKIARSVCLDQKGTLWVGTMSGGLACWQSNRFVRLDLPILNAITPLESVTACPAFDGSLWIGTLRHGLMQLKAGKIERPLPANDLPSVRILFEDSQRRLWIGGLADLRCYEHGRFRLFGEAEGFQSRIAVGVMAEDVHGAIWIGTGPGDLWKFQAGKFTRFPPPREWPSFRFSALQADAGGSIWIGTLGGGLLRFKDGRYFRFTGAQDLPNGSISQLREDSQGNLWAGTYAGIVRISKSNLNDVADGKESHLVCRVFGRSSGLLALECTSGFQPSCWTSPEGQLWFSTAAGLACINPHDKVIMANQAPPPVAIEEILVDGVQRPMPSTRQSPKSPAGTPSELRIEPGQHFLQFRYAGLNLAAPDEVSFRVKLEGAETKWRNLGYQRTVGYGPLAPGHYCLRVLACSSGGLWNEKGAALAFSVLPFFWQTLWFKGGLLATFVLSTGLILTLALTRKHRVEMRKLRAQHELDRERSRIAQDLHDDLGTSLTQINLLSALADRETARHELASLNQQIRQSARAMVAALDEIVWAVNPRNDSASELVNYLANLAEDFFRASSISCRLEIPSRLPDRSLPSEVRHHAFLVFKETINNVARHSNAAHVWINVAASAEEVTISIKDDGRGFDASEPGFMAGNGLSNIQSRMKEIRGRAEVSSARGRGTNVTIYVPLK
jgi:ligand-binding sensor domain-containing protein